MQPIRESYEKSFTALQHWLLGKEYNTAARALQFMRTYQTGMRKDGITPVEIHPLTVANYLRTLHATLAYPEETIATALLHDVVEDTPVSIEVIEQHFGNRIRVSTWLVTKQYGGIRKSNTEYFHAMAEDPIAPLVKGADRIHNAQSMVGVFTQEKQREYIAETEGYIIPMLKRARHIYPNQTSAFQNIKLILVSQIELIRHIHAAQSATA